MQLGGTQRAVRQVSLGLSIRTLARRSWRSAASEKSDLGPENDLRLQGVDGSASAALQERSAIAWVRLRKPGSEAANVVESSVDRLVRAMGRAVLVEVGQHVAGAVPEWLHQARVVISSSSPGSTGQSEAGPLAKGQSFRGDPG